MNSSNIRNMATGLLPNSKSKYRLSFSTCLRRKTHPKPTNVSVHKSNLGESEEGEGKPREAQRGPEKTIREGARFHAV